jgi:hypothetical protein
MIYVFDLNKIRSPVYAKLRDTFTNLNQSGVKECVGHNTRWVINFYRYYLRLSDTSNTSVKGIPEAAEGGLIFK